MDTDTPEPTLNEMTSHLDGHEVTLAVALGLVVQYAAEAEYVLHSITVNLAESLGRKDKEIGAYEYMPAEFGTAYIKECRKLVRKLGDSPHVPQAARAALLRDLDLLSKRFDQRNRYVHGVWSWDPDSRQFRTIKGIRPKKGVNRPKRPEILVASVADVYKLATELARLRDKLTTWDATFFGVWDEDSEGFASQKRL